ncbi:hypothetical protein Tco_0147725 [Tanacetum coccineum]
MYNPLSKIEATKSESLLKEATESPTGHSKKKKPLASTHVVDGMHKEVHLSFQLLPLYTLSLQQDMMLQLIIQLKMILENLLLMIFLSKQQGNDKGTKKYSIDNIIAGTNPDVLEASYDQEEFNTYLELTSSNDAKEIKLEDRSNLVKDVGIDLIDMDSLKDDQPVRFMKKTRSPRVLSIIA